ncbi:MAG: SH3 domain-containing protein [Rhodanobacteraceae bacterium]|nr:SH3 domain-containing protein [Rhodanobacteraceae bacterium]
MRLVLTWMLAVSAAAVAGTDNAPQLPEVGFAGLSVQTAPSQCFGPVSVHFDPALATPRDDFIELPDHPAGGWRVMLAGRLDRNSQDRYEVRYDDGPSCDPTFTLWREGDEAPLGEFGGDHLVLPGNGFLYVIRRSNRSFEGREKWAVRKGQLVEVTQSHYYVGVHTHTRKTVKLLQTPAAGAETIAAVPPGERVQIVVQQVIDGRDWYLVRTPFGLLGWTEDAAYGEDRQFEDLQFFGD